MPHQRRLRECKELLIDPTKQHSTLEEPRIELTGDGSHTLFSPRFNQQYHDTNGAIDESRHVFLDHGSFLRRVEANQDIHVFEMGFGTGLNLLLVSEALHQSSSASNVVYTSIEGYPVHSQTAARLNYPSLLNPLPGPFDLPSIFEQSKAGVNRFSLHPRLELRLFIGLFADYPFDDLPIDCVFFDAFSPKANPELWTSSVFSAIYHHASEGAVMSTYCAAVSARAAMCHAGWHVARGPGCKTRREMTIASNDARLLEAWPRVNETNYRRRYESGEFQTVP